MSEYKDFDFTATGSVVHVGDTTVITEKFQKRDMFIETRKNPNYPETVAFELHQDRCDLVDNIGFGDKVRVFFNLKGRTWNDKVFNTLVAWRVQKLNDDGSIYDPGAYVPPVTSATTQMTQQAPAPQDDDLPF